MSAFKIRLSELENDNVTEAGDDPANAAGLSPDMDQILASLASSTVIDNLLSKNLLAMSNMDFDQWIEGFIREQGEASNKSETRSLSTAKKIAYGTVLSLCFLGASSSVLGLMPLGAEATARDRAIGIIQFLLTGVLVNGNQYTCAMYKGLRQVDDHLTDYLQGRFDGGANGNQWSSVLQDIRQCIADARWQDVVPMVIALAIAAYSPMLDALNSREGGINLVARGEPSRMAAATAFGNLLLVLNWTAGFALPAIMSKSLFNGYIAVFETLWKGARVERSSVTMLAGIIRRKMVKDAVCGTDSHLSAVSIETLLNQSLTEAHWLLNTLIRAADHKGADRTACFDELLAELGLEAEALQAFSHEQVLQASHQSAGDARLDSVLSKALEEMIESPLFSKKVLQVLRGDPADKHANALARLKAALKLVVRGAISWLALNGLGVTLAAPMVVNHYKSYMEDPALDIDCHYFGNISADIEPFDNTLFELSVGSYMAQGLSMSDAAIKTLELLLIPMGFTLSEIDGQAMNQPMRQAFREVIRQVRQAMNRTRHALWRNCDKTTALATVASGIGVATYVWVLASAGNKYQEYLDLLGCNKTIVDIPVPDSVLAVELPHADLITQILMPVMLFHIGVSSLKNLFSNVSFNGCGGKKEPLPDQTDMTESKTAEDADELEEVRVSTSKLIDP